jgi:hypothetical protein
LKANRGWFDIGKGDGGSRLKVGRVMRHGIGLLGKGRLAGCGRRRGTDGDVVLRLFSRVQKIILIVVILERDLGREMRKKF